ncbi:hypothetical protein B0H14DRAFT_3152890 [Mycena olivaceomarginata]|nr:hypothetical protein B0H14DRAFT_3152890 [Mycena olivaceomarginata]
MFNVRQRTALVDYAVRGTLLIVDIKSRSGRQGNPFNCKLQLCDVGKVGSFGNEAGLSHGVSTTPWTDSRNVNMDVKRWQKEFKYGLSSSVTTRSTSSSRSSLRQRMQKKSSVIDEQHWEVVEGPHAQRWQMQHRPSLNTTELPIPHFFEYHRLGRGLGDQHVPPASLHSFECVGRLTPWHRHDGRRGTRARPGSTLLTRQEEVVPEEADSARGGQRIGLEEEDTLQIRGERDGLPCFADESARRRADPAWVDERGRSTAWGGVDLGTKTSQRIEVAAWIGSER